MFRSPGGPAAGGRGLHVERRAGVSGAVGRVPRTAGPIKLDGVLDEAAWGKAEPLRDFAVFWQNRKPRTATTARLLWDDDYLYFSADMEDADLYAVVKERNGMTWYDDVFEMFLKPSEDKLPYYEFQVNALNTDLELFFPRAVPAATAASPRSASSAWSRPSTSTARSTTGRTWTRAGPWRAASRGRRSRLPAGGPRPATVALRPLPLRLLRDARPPRVVVHRAADAVGLPPL